MSTQPHQPCGNVWLVTSHSCLASRQIRDFDDATPAVPSLSRRTKNSTMLRLPFRLGLSPALSRPWTGAVPAWSAPDCLPWLAILGPPLLPPMRFSRTTSAPASWMMPSSALAPRCESNFSSRTHNQPLVHLTATEAAVRLPRGMLLTCHPARLPEWPTYQAQVLATIIQHQRL